MARGCLVSLTSSKTLRCKQTLVHDTKTVSGIHSDIERACDVFKHVHDFAFSLIEAALALWLLTRLLGLATVASVFVFAGGYPFIGCYFHLGIGFAITWNPSLSDFCKHTGVCVGSCTVQMAQCRGSPPYGDL